MGRASCDLDPERISNVRIERPAAILVGAAVPFGSKRCGSYVGVRRPRGSTFPGTGAPAPSRPRTTAAAAPAEPAGSRISANARASATTRRLWHGTGSTAGEYALMARAVAEGVTSEGGILASFQGSVGTGGDCSGTGIFSKDDFKIADQIVACAVRDHNIDPRRIYSTGCSAGGLQTGCMATLRSSYLAAAAPNSGGVVFPQKFDDPSHAPAIMTMHGGSQDNVGVSFATTSKSLDTQFKNAGGFVINCNHGGSHCGAPAALYKSVWDFFKAHPFGVAPEPYESGVPSSFPSYCQVF